MNQGNNALSMDSELNQDQAEAVAVNSTSISDTAKMNDTIDLTSQVGNTLTAGFELSQNKTEVEVISNIAADTVMVETATTNVSSDYITAWRSIITEANDHNLKIDEFWAFFDSFCPNSKCSDQELDAILTSAFIPMAQKAFGATYSEDTIKQLINIITTEQCRYEDDFYVCALTQYASEHLKAQGTEISETSIYDATVALLDAANTI